MRCMVTPGQMVNVHADYCAKNSQGLFIGENSRAVVLQGVQAVCPELCWSHPHPTNFLKTRTDQPFHPTQRCRHGGMRTEKGSRFVFLVGFTDDLQKTDSNPYDPPFWYGGSLT